MTDFPVRRFYANRSIQLEHRSAMNALAGQANSSNAAAIPMEELEHAIRRGIEFLAREQRADGSWRGDYGGPMFLLPMYVAASYICRKPIPDEQREQMTAYIFAVQNGDGSIGLHAEARQGTVFTSVLAYVALRILGESADNERMERTRNWILNNGTALATASWGKWMLALLNLYDYAGVRPILPELFLLPYFLPFHPARFWCHARQVYLPAAYLFATKACIPKDDLIRDLREEIYDQDYQSICFEKHRDTVAPCDQLAIRSRLADVCNAVCLAWDRYHPAFLRRRALEKIVDHVLYEDRVTDFVRLGPVNAVLNTVVHHFRTNDEMILDRSWNGLSQYLFCGHDGLKMNGYISSSLWDTAFTVQTFLDSGFADDYRSSLNRARRYIDENQITEDVPERGWGFGDKVNGWPVADCTAEGVKATLALETFLDASFPDDRLRDSIRLILDYQNRDGGWPTYERQRSGAWLERLNPSGVFRDIMVDYSYVECTSACIQGLTKALARFPGEFDREISRAISRGVRFIRRRQRNDGSWEGSWGICFTYGTWFGVTGLLAAGVCPDAVEIRRAVQFLVNRQNADGGWGEDYESCLQRDFVPGRESHVVNTAWSLLTVVAAGLADSDVARRAARFMISRQQTDGDWPREPMAGVFNKTAVINYENYRRYFSIWALSKFLHSMTSKRQHAQIGQNHPGCL